MPHQTEPSANNAMGNLLQAMLPRSQVRSENTRAIAGQPGRLHLNLDAKSAGNPHKRSDDKWKSLSAC